MKKGFSIVFSILLFGSFAEANRSFQVLQDNTQELPKRPLLGPVELPFDVSEKLNKDDFRLPPVLEVSPVLEKRRFRENWRIFFVKVFTFLHILPHK